MKSPEIGNAVLMRLCVLMMLMWVGMDVVAQVDPKVELEMWVEYNDSTGYKCDTLRNDSLAYVEAPATVHCKITPVYDAYDLNTYRTNFEWTITKDNEETPIVDRFNETLDYTIDSKGSYKIHIEPLLTRQDGKEFTFGPYNTTVVIKESELDCPNAFSPNGDNRNDVFRMTKLQSIVELEGEIYNRWGQVLHTFTLDNIKDGWDGYYNGKVVKDGAYILRIYAKGSEGREYKIRKVINVLKGYRTKDQ